MNFQVNDIIEVTDPKSGPWLGRITTIMDCGTMGIWGSVAATEGKGGTAVKLTDNENVRKVK